MISFTVVRLMKHKNLTHLSAGLGLALLAGTANAISIDSSIDGIWWEGEEKWGRGIILHVTDEVTGEKMNPRLIMDWFTYDNNGNQIWLHGSKEIEGSGNALTLDLARLTGGRFDDQHRYADTTTTNWGTATLTFDDCGSGKIEFSGQDGSGTYTLMRRTKAKGTQCVYDKPFERCPDFAQPMSQPGYCLLQGEIKQNVTLTNNITWVLQGGVFFGGDNTDSVTVTIEPGTKIMGQQAADFFYVRRGSKINAVGAPDAPIIFTGPLEQTPGEWGGLVIAGNAPVNGCNEGVDLCEQQDEAMLTPYGGNDPHDNSGILKYVQIRWAGYAVRPDQELNGFTLLGVGDGTQIDYVEIYEGLDDGIEFFGGTANARHLVLVNNHDDSLDWGGGWTGKVQYVLAKQADNDADRCIEADNNETNFDSQPRAKPAISNFMCLGSASGSQGAELRRGTGANIHNSVFVGSPSACIRISDAATFTNAGTPGNLTGELTIDHSYVNCPTNFKDGSGATFSVADWFNSQAGNHEADPQLEGYLPKDGSPLISGGAPVTDDSFFDGVDYIGPFKSKYDDWTKGWTIGL